MPLQQPNAAELAQEKLTPAARKWDERELAKKVCENDEQAIKALVVDYLVPAANALCWKFRAFKIEYDDLLQNLFLRLFNNDWKLLREWRRECSLRSWAFLHASNICVRQAQYRARFEILLKELELEYREPQSPDPGKPAQQRETRAMLLRALEQLSEQERFVVSESCLSGTAISEIADALGITNGSTSVIKHRALKRLREILRRGGAADA